VPLLGSRELARLREPVHRVLAYDAQHRETREVLVFLWADQALVDERGQHLEHVDLAVRVADVFGGEERERALEYPEPYERGLLFLG
jgi:hypothetical protein